MEHGVFPSSLAPHFPTHTIFNFFLQGSHTHLPPPAHSGGCLHWSRRGWGGQAGAGGVAWQGQDPALGPDSRHSRHPRTPDSTSTPYLLPFCRPRGSEDGGSCGTWERWREGSLLLAVLSVTAAPVHRGGRLQWGRPVPQAGSPLPFSMWSCSADSCQLVGQGPNSCVCPPTPPLTPSCAGALNSPP